MTDLSIIVVSWNTSKLLRQCLVAVTQTTQELDVEVLVVDNASSDGSAAMVRQYFPKAQLIENSENLGFAMANNQAIRASKGRYILLLNSDAFLIEGAAAAMVQFMDLHNEAGIVGANLIYPDGKPQPSHSSLPTLLSDIKSLLGLDKAALWLHSKDRVTNEIETGTVSGACLLARRSMLDQIGLFDDEFFMYSEEVDLCFRAQKSGWKVYHLPFARTIHVGSGSSGPTAKRMLMLYQGKLNYYAKHYGASHQKRFLAAIMIATRLKILIYSLANKVNRGGRPKDDFWRSVLDGLSEISV
jgi:GT2 family glycosyltransferase